jgi:hypothetical protein
MHGVHCGCINGLRSSSHESFVPPTAMGANMQCRWGARGHSLSADDVSMQMMISKHATGAMRPFDVKVGDLSLRGRGSGGIERKGAMGVFR